MTYHDAITLIDNPWLHNGTTPTHWADLGCGSGVFTLALADLLAPGSTIEAIDLNPTIAEQTTARGVRIIPRKADFTKLDLTPANAGDPSIPCASNIPAAPVAPGIPASPPAPDSTTATASAKFDGILMANALHYVQNKQEFLEKLKNIPVVLVEYDTDRPIASWVPYPLSATSASRLFQNLGWISFEKLAARPSSFGGSHLYSALALPPGAHKDPSTISPSAYALLLMKGQTNIPYARQAADLLRQQTPTDIPSFSTNPAEYWTRVMHFESRYWSINQLMEGLTAMNILELSSGFSFRGLAMSEEKPVYYIDTDLPNIIAGKQKFIDAFAAARTQPAEAAETHADAQPPHEAARTRLPGHYELLPMNALDPLAFEAIVNRFPPGPITIVNEGLLVYLDPQEKERLCRNILTTLRNRGGHWITADIYIMRKQDDPLKEKNESWRRWERQHRIEEKKFPSFHEAENFFHRMGFKIEKEAKPDYARLTSLSQLVAAAGPQALENLKRLGRNRLHATWLLTPRR